MSKVLPLFHEKLVAMGFSSMDNQELRDPKKFDYYEIRFENLFSKEILADKIKRQFFAVQVSMPEALQKDKIKGFKISYGICLGEDHPKLGQIIGGLECNVVSYDQFFSDLDSIVVEARKMYNLAVMWEEGNLK